MLSDNMNTIINNMDKAYSKIYKVVKNKQDAEDLSQDAFIKVLEKKDVLKNIRHIKSWFLTIAKNESIDYIRSSDFQKTSRDVDVYSLNLESIINNSNYHTNHDDILYAEISKLPPRQKEILELKIIKDNSFKDIAILLDIQYNTVKVNYHHAMINLRNSPQIQGLLNG